MQHSVAYKLSFAVGLCAVCALFVSTLSVALHDRQEANRRMLGQGRQILSVAGLIGANDELSREDIAEKLFRELEPRIVELATGAVIDDVDALAFDQAAASDDPATSREVGENPAGVQRVPQLAKIFVRRGDEGDETYVLPIEGQGLWGIMRGFLAVDGDGRTIRGITFYEHSETPGYGAEVDTPEWKASWPGRLAYDDDGIPKIAVAKGTVGPPDRDPYRVDGMSGSTLTGDAVTHLVRFWLGDDGFGPFLRNRREGNA